MKNKQSSSDLQNSRMPAIQTHHLLFTPCIAQVQLKRFYPMPEGEQGEERTVCKMFIFTLIPAFKSHPDGRATWLQLCTRLTWQCWVSPCLGSQEGRMERTRAHPCMSNGKNQEVFKCSRGLLHLALHRSCILCLCNTGKHRTRRTIPWQQKQQIRSSPFFSEKQRWGPFFSSET